MPRDVRVVLVGDRNTGKTSLVCTLCEEEIDSDELAPVHEVVRVPPSATTNGANTVIVDTSLRVMEEAHIEEEIRRADVLCLVYAVNDPPSFAHLSSYWLPLVRRARASDGERNAVPVVVVGNKLDLQTEATHDVGTLMHTHTEIDTAIECSAASKQNVMELFYFAQRAVLHPLSTLYDTRAHSLRPPALAALSRIFALCDRNRDGVLDDEELQQFQVLCFNAPLSPQELVQVKEVVAHSIDNGLSNGGLTCQGFFFLHRNFIERGLLEATWLALRRFGYDEHLSLSITYAHPLLPPGRTELSEAGEEFLRSLFSRHEVGGVLPAERAMEMWSLCPSPPFLDMIVAGPGGREAACTLETFLLLWRVLVYDDAQEAMGLLAYLGFGLFPPAPVSAAIRVMRSTLEDRMAASTQRSVFAVSVLGPPLCGKSTYLRRLASHGLLLRSPDSGEVRAAVVVPTTTRSVVLVIRESNLKHRDVDSVASSFLTDTCDAALFLFDRGDPSSLGDTLDLLERVAGRGGMVCVLAGTKEDTLVLPQDYPQTPEQACLSRALPPPAPSPLHALQSLAAACLSPKPLPSPSPLPSSPSFCKFVGVGLLLAGLAVLVWMRIKRREG